MRPLARIFLCVLIALSNLSCSVNILENFADKDTNEALYNDAIAQVNDADYTAAIATIAKMKGTYPTLAKVLDLKASAYAGRCGLVFIPFAQALAAMGTTHLFPFLINYFRATSTGYIDDCVAAETALLTVGSVSVRSDDENMAMAMVGFAKIGVILSFYADGNFDGVGDKMPAAAADFDPCVVNASRTTGSFSDADARELGTGITQVIANLTALASKVNLGAATLTSLNSLCSSLGGSNFCAVTDPAAFSANEVKGIRTLVKEDAVVGLGTNCTGGVGACNCP